MLGHHLPPTIGRFESILEAWPNVCPPIRLDTRFLLARSSLGHDGKTRQSLSNLLPMRLDRCAEGTRARRKRRTYPHSREPTNYRRHFDLKGSATVDAPTDRTACRSHDKLKYHRCPSCTTLNITPRVTGQTHWSARATSLRRNVWFDGNDVCPVCRFVLLSTAATHLFDAYDRYGFPRHSTRKPTDKRKTSFSSFRGNRGFAQQTRDLANQPRAFFFTRHLRAVSLARMYGKQSPSITTER